MIIISNVFASMLHTLVAFENRCNFHRYPCLQTARLLLQCGADVNVCDAQQNTSLHIIASDKLSCDESLLNLLEYFGAHFDYANCLGHTPADLATNYCVYQWLKNRMNLCLKCQCARLIRRENIDFRDKLSSSLVKFIEKH